MGKIKWALLNLACLLCVSCIVTMILHFAIGLDQVWLTITGFFTSIVSLILSIWNLKDRKR